mmetsp:Transcript_6560/g.17823  ORF Transcript_6560/g.17823 Transcript_6560/m.17823 type:complete len:149 (-) Transcript_6560:570-1016(-)|eukprot:CAMPEP_0198114438 /NCGR_PEP_ID=MMETSP1442-20131203/5823_1 /TAXON_ID= /ORGANISM="Craspedostauros australis, Strain CCMP3328" /LENGTH=148 /DNA_ID=CAMNT_0043771747 /DNA_START=121 /DNA_END=567 /DNA_ORIENTATION=-
MKVTSLLSITLAALATSADAFVVGTGAKPAAAFGVAQRNSALHAKYNSMDEILALFPEDKPVLINFYDADKEADIKGDILTCKDKLKDRCTMVSIKQQDYPELAKLWDAHERSPSMILFKDGNPVTRLYETTFYLDVATKIGKYCDDV